jgi:hypothetical protein
MQSYNWNIQDSGAVSTGSVPYLNKLLTVDVDGFNVKLLEKQYGAKCFSINFIICIFNPIIKEGEMGGTCSTNERDIFINTHNVFRKTEGKISLGRPSHRLEDDIKMDFKETRCESVYWIQVDQDRVQ